jgi:hypothetical protein|tara:strand:+ start:383 stop:553 length:171 start_codon:yes stop_codon:yes gene_type:complete
VSGKRYYEEDYYAAFVLDPSRNKIEAACLNPEHEKLHTAHFVVLCRGQGSEPMEKK